jgi:hypothetical protein
MLRRVERDHQAAASEVVRELATLRAASSGSGVILDSLSARTSRLEKLAGQVVRAGSPQLAAAQLATMLGDFATASGARVNSTILRSDTAFSKSLTRVSVRLSITTDVQGLAAVLRRIERDARLLAVRELAVSGNDPGAPQTRAEILVADILVETLAVEAEFQPPARRHSR